MSPRPQLIITVTKKVNVFKSRQKYRFRITDAGNNRVLASSNDAYVNVGDALKTAFKVTGGGPDDPRVLVRLPDPTTSV